MALGLPEDLWKGGSMRPLQECQEGGGYGSAKHPFGSRKNRARGGLTRDQLAADDCRPG